MQVVAFKIDRRDEAAGHLAIVPLVAIAHPLQAEPCRHVHAKLQDAQTAIEHVIGVFLALEHGLEQRLAFVQPLANPPLLEPDEADQRIHRAPRLQLGEIDPAPAPYLGPLL